MALSKTRQSPSMVLAPCSCALSCAHGKTGVGHPAQPARGMPRAHGANGLGEGHPPPLDSFRGARTGRAESRAKAKAKKKAANGCLFCILGSDPSAQQRALTPAFDLAFAHPSAAGRLEGSGRQGCPGPLAPWMAPSSPQGGGRFACEALLRKRPNAQPPAAGPDPGGGFTACPGQPCRPGPCHEAQRGNALNLTAPRKYPPRPCPCRCTSSPCRTSAGDGAGRAAASRYGSRRSRPAGDPGRSHHPAG